MKKTTTILLMILFSTLLNAQDNFDNLWKKVEQFDKDNLPQSALNVVETIYNKAEKSNNASQVIKSLIYKSKYTLILEEDAQLKIINQFKQQINKSKFPTKNMLQNMLANLYWQYFNQNRWKFYERNETAKKVNENDFRTWDLQTLFAEINSYYQQSLQDKKQLQKVDSRVFKDIIEKGKDSKKYRPTLFDFLAHNALQFYTTSETNITKPSYQFKIDNEKYLSAITSFVKVDLNTKDDESLQFNALKIYQELLSFHLKNDNLYALADTDIQRLLFVNQHATFNNKAKVLEQSLKTAVNTFKNNEISGLYLYEIAKNYHQQASLYTKTNQQENRFKNQEALALCKQVIKKFPDSYAANKCKELQKQITQDSLSMVAEQFILVNAPSKLLVTYKNIDKLYFSAYKISFKQLQEYEKAYYSNEKFNFIKKLEKTISWSNDLRNEKDYLQHNTEVIVPKLPNGIYLVVAHKKESFNDKELFAVANFQATNLALVENSNGLKKTYQVVDRYTGAPVENAKLLLQNKRYSHGIEIHKTLTTDNNGFATYKSSNDFPNVYITVTTPNDQAVFGNYSLYTYKDFKPNNDNYFVTKPYIFTDRSIYRPGQTVYFKAIFIRQLNDDSKPFTNQSVDLTLKDANHQKVKTITLKLNEYGAASGELILPNNGLTGEYYFSVSETTKTNHFYFTPKSYLSRFSVEEYKRPKFKTAFNPITKTYKINDNVTINGFAKAFSGSNITDAKVVYRVHRKVEYPIWCYWRKPQYFSEAQEITHGELTTDANGKFAITFKALPDESVDKKDLPIFNYEVTADVTDINGETRSATTIVKVGYHALLATVQIPSEIKKSSNETTIEISTKNLNGEFVPAEGNLKIYKLQAPKNPLRNRLWEAPDYQDISEAEFRKLFPYESYTKSEKNVQQWKKGKLVFEETFNTNTSKETILKNYKNWPIGNYVIELNSKDTFGQPVIDKSYFVVTSNNEKSVADNQLFAYSLNKKSYEPNDVVELQLGSASKDITVVVQVEKNQRVVSTELVRLNNNVKTIKIPVTKDDIGGFVVDYYYVNYNSFVSGTIPISVITKQNTITIETQTFRDKLQPGSDETWSFTIKNDKNNKVAAEVLASMYDASLDEFKPHQWEFTPISNNQYSSFNNSNIAHQSFGTERFKIHNESNFYPTYNYYPQYDRLNWFGFNFGHQTYARGRLFKTAMPASVEINEVASDAVENEESLMVGNAVSKKEDKKTTDEAKVSFDGVQIRKNLQETAFFYPHLQTDKEGNITFTFKTPEALTKWKLQLLAYTKELQSATKTLTAVTQKELMVTPNAPRFLREGDQITFSTKITNISNKNLKGTAQLVLTDAVTGKEINLLNKSSKNQSFKVDANGNTQVSWELNIPNTHQAIQYKIIAKSGDFSDGEQNVLPVLSNRMLVTETIPMWVRSNQTKTFSLDKLKNNTSTTLRNHKLTLEVTSNPAWYAVQALPYLMEYPYNCSEQTFARYYANTLASHIANSNPRIKDVFNAWKSSDALLGNLEKNQELKSLIIQETPWLRDAQSEAEQKKRIALLFDLNKMNNEQQKAIKKLAEMQFSNGGFPWFKGSFYVNDYITNHIATGIGHLQNLNVKLDNDIVNIANKTVNYLDEKIVSTYKDLLKQAKEATKNNGKKEYEAYLEKNHLNYFIIQYLYMRSFYKNTALSNETKKAVEYYKNQTSKYWNDFNLYGKGQIALLQFRNENTSVANKIIASLKENSITSDKLGMYWKENQPSWYWYQSPIETQSLLIEAFAEIENDVETIDNLKIWLLKNKQTNQWKTTKATTEAVYALLLQGSDWISVTDMVDVTIGKTTINPSKLENVKVEAGTGYYKTSWSGSEITPDMATISIAKKDKGIAWGGLYWQYFEDLDKITSAKTPLQLQKKLFKKVNSDKGKQLQEITNKTPLQVGDLVTVRIELKSDRDMEFIHMKDMRASGVEPVNVISQYKRQDGLGYYESTKDASTNFFFDFLPKGIYVFEYDVRVNNAGVFSNGITTIQSMYAPEFSSHSEGKKLHIK